MTDKPPPPQPYEPSLCATPAPELPCAHIIGVHEVKGTGLERKHGRCSAGIGLDGHRCQCPGSTPEPVTS